MEDTFLQEILVYNYQEIPDPPIYDGLRQKDIYVSDFREYKFFIEPFTGPFQPGAPYLLIKKNDDPITAFKFTFHNPEKRHATFKLDTSSQRAGSIKDIRQYSTFEFLGLYQEYYRNDILENLIEYIENNEFAEEIYGR